MVKGDGPARCILLYLNCLEAVAHLSSTGCLSGATLIERRGKTVKAGSEETRRIREGHKRDLPLNLIRHPYMLFLTVFSAFQSFQGIRLDACVCYEPATAHSDYILHQLRGENPAFPA